MTDTDTDIHPDEARERSPYTALHDAFVAGYQTAYVPSRFRPKVAVQEVEHAWIEWFQKNQGTNNE